MAILARASRFGDGVPAPRHDPLRGSALLPPPRPPGDRVGGLTAVEGGPDEIKSNPGVEYERDGAGLATRGLYLDVGPWEHHVFEVVST